MKKAVCFLLLPVILSVCSSCLKQNNPELLFPQTFPYEKEVVFFSEDREIDAVFTVENENSKSLRILLPEELGGITFTESDGKRSVCANGVSFEVGREAFPEKGLLFDAFSLHADSEFLADTRTQDGKKYTVFTHVSEDGNLLFYTDETGALVKLAVEGAYPFVFSFKTEK